MPRIQAVGRLTLRAGVPAGPPEPPPLAPSYSSHDLEVVKPFLQFPFRLVCVLLFWTGEHSQTGVPGNCLRKAGLPFAGCRL